MDCVRSAALGALARTSTHRPGQSSCGCVMRSRAAVDCGSPSCSAWTRSRVGVHGVPGRRAPFRAGSPRDGVANQSASGWSGMAILIDSAPMLQKDTLRIHPLPGSQDNYLWVAEDGRTPRPWTDERPRAGPSSRRGAHAHGHPRHPRTTATRRRRGMGWPIAGMRLGSGLARRSTAHDGFGRGDPSRCRGSAELDVLEVPDTQRGHMPMRIRIRLLRPTPSCAAAAGGSSRARRRSCSPRSPSSPRCRPIRASTAPTSTRCQHPLRAGAVEPQREALRPQRARCRRARRQPPTLPDHRRRARHQPVPSLGLAEVIASASKHAGRALATPVEVFAAVREWKNNFRQT